MAQTKRKRRSKHRGNAAGSVEVRGRTGRKPDQPAPRKGGAVAAGGRVDRRFAEPTWGGAALRAGIASVMLFVLFQVGLTGQKQPLITALALSLAAFLIYVPLGYKVDRIFWQRRMRKAGRALPSPPAKGRR